MTRYNDTSGCVKEEISEPQKVVDITLIDVVVVVVVAVAVLRVAVSLIRGAVLVP